MNRTALRRAETRLGLRRQHLSEENCPRPRIGAIISAGEVLPTEEEIVVCSTCGNRHVLEIEEVIVDAEGPRP